MKTYLGLLVARERGAVGAITPRLAKWYEPMPRPAPLVSLPKLTQSRIRETASIVQARPVPDGDARGRHAGEPSRPRAGSEAVQSSPVSRASEPEQTRRPAPASNQALSGSSVPAPFVLGKLRSVRAPTSPPASAVNPVAARHGAVASGPTGPTGPTEAVPDARRQTVVHPDLGSRPARDTGSPHAEQQPSGQSRSAPMRLDPAAIRPREQPAPQVDQDDVPSAERAVQVTIGKVEIRAVQQPIGRAAPPSVLPPMTLDEYLRGRSGAGR